MLDIRFIPNTGILFGYYFKHNYSISIPSSLDPTEYVNQCKIVISFSPVATDARLVINFPI